MVKVTESLSHGSVGRQKSNLLDRNKLCLAALAAIGLVFVKPRYTDLRFLVHIKKWIDDKVPVDGKELSC
jgi:hypothetical protein